MLYNVQQEEKKTDHESSYAKHLTINLKLKIQFSQDNLNSLKSKTQSDRSKL